ncbi:thiamine phosphate synthase [Sphingobacterium anhuiense]|uniref:Thiamine-phosphate synthase n=1 Tax=Sphingobacterium anhuiense TaxID=493780 RepID=A0ABW5YT58_9SPHI
MNLDTSFPYQLYLVISEQDCRGKNFLHVAEKAILGGVDVIQLREKNLTSDLYLAKAKQLKEITDKYTIPLIINDNLEVAQELNAAGIHVGNRDISPSNIRQVWNSPRPLVGYSIENLEQLKNPQIPLSDYLGISPVFNTETKKDTITEWGLKGIVEIRQRTDKPLVAIGNIHIQNARRVIQAGADCLAVVSAICGSEDPEKAAYELKNEILK